MGILKSVLQFSAWSGRHRSERQSKIVPSVRLHAILAYTRPRLFPEDP